MFGTRTETKNVNSLRSVERAVRYEITRQAAILAAGGRIKQETRHFDESTGTTAPGRSKETAEDYRYFPEPDLVPLAPEPEWVEETAGVRCRSSRGCGGTGCRQAWGLTDPEMRDLVAADAVELVAATVDAGASPAEARSWWASYLGQQANSRGVALADLPITPGAAGGRHRQGVVRRADHEDGPAGGRRRCWPARAAPTR